MEYSISTDIFLTSIIKTNTVEKKTKALKILKEAKHM